MSRVMLCFGVALSSLASAENGMPPLAAATRTGDLAAIRALLDGGADPNEHDTRVTDWPPLLHALHTRQIAAARLLLDRGASPNSASPTGYTALMMAILDRNVQAVS